MSGAARFRLPDAGIRLDSMPSTGRDLDLIVDPEIRNEVADQIGITAVEKLEVKLHAVRFKGGIRVTGQLWATIVQPSVVSLEPVTQEIVEPIDRIFLPGGEKAYAGPADAEIFVDLEGDDMPDHFEGNEADLTELILETLSLALDPYPRLPDETLGEVGDGDMESDLPFAGLKVLKGDKQ
ncbi:MAG: YceD family protein [Devosia sp.]